MVRVLQVIEIEGQKYVSLEDYQQLMREYEKLQPPVSNADIIADAGEDEVYSE